MITTPHNSILVRGKILQFDGPKVMGILNATPDSFYNKGHHAETANLLEMSSAMISEGADILDIGGASSRPGAANVSVKEELKRVLPVIESIRQAHPHTLISIDTFQAAVASAAINAGADIVNDISAGLLDHQMMDVVAALGVPYIMMHMRGTPATMNGLTQYGHLMNEITHYFIQRMHAARLAGIKDIMLDPGFGFAKNAAQNFQLLQHLEDFKIFGMPLLAGLSRKRMIYSTLNTTADAALNGTTALNMIALQKGAQILRVHDVKAARECIVLYEQLMQND